MTDFLKSVPGPGRPVRARSRSSRSAPTATGTRTPAPALRRHFEVDAAHLVVATLDGLAQLGDVKGEVVADAIRTYEIDAEAPDPRTT